ncbi:MAG: hypothetical protein P8189_16290 [Anaerolineae bacterium]
MTHEQKGPREVPGYYSYLLRLWREKGSASIQWRASLQDPHSSERVGFAHLDELVAFLREQTGLAAPVEDLAKAQSAPETDLPSEEG